MSAPEVTSSECSTKKASAKGAGSFCVPRAAIHALLDAGATAHEIVSYLTLARFTDASGQFSTAGISAISRATGANKTSGGTLDRSLARLRSIEARIDGPETAKGQKQQSAGPILMLPEDWFDLTGEIPPDGPTERRIVRFVLPDFGERLHERVWFSNALVTGVADFSRPLKCLKDAGDVAARLLISLYLNHDMEAYGGIRPRGGTAAAVFQTYRRCTEPIPLKGGFALYRAKSSGHLAWMDSRVQSCGEEFWSALHALEVSGFLYEVVMAFNRTGAVGKFSNGNTYEQIPEDAEPLYELGARSAVGYAPEGERGLGGELAKLAGELGHPVTETGGKLNGTYAVVVRANFPVMVAGVYRMRFRVTNTKNAGVVSAWSRIHENNRDAVRLLDQVRSSNGLAGSANSSSRPHRAAFADFF